MHMQSKSLGYREDGGFCPLCDERAWLPPPGARLELTDNHDERVLLVTDDRACALALRALSELNDRLSVCASLASLERFRETQFDRVVVVMLRTPLDSCASAIRSQLLHMCTDPVHVVSPIELRRPF